MTHCSPNRPLCRPIFSHSTLPVSQPISCMVVHAGTCSRWYMIEPITMFVQFLWQLMNSFSLSISPMYGRRTAHEAGRTAAWATVLRGPVTGGPCNAICCSRLYKKPWS